MVVKNGKAPARRKSASSSSVKARSNTVPKSSKRSSDSKETDQLDGIVDLAQATALESEAGDRMVEAAGIAERVSGRDLSTEPTELTAITLHQPWASLIAAGKKHYETRSWATYYRGPIAIHAGKKLHKDESLTSLLEVDLKLFDSNIPLGAIVAIADLTDCILMDQEFILKQSSFEQYLGLWEIGRYAWKLENVRAIEPIPATGKQGLWKFSSDSWNPADFGEAEYKSEASGQLNFLEVNEPPDPDDYDSIEQFDEAFRNWCDAQTDEAEEELANFGEQELCNTLMDGSTFAAELVPASPTLESNYGSEALTISASGTVTATQFLEEDIQKSSNDSAISKPLISNQNLTTKYNSSLLARLVNHSQSMESDKLLQIAGTAFPMCSEQSKNSNPTSQSLKTLPDSLTVPIPPATNQEATSATSSTPYRRAGTMQNGIVLGVTSLPVPGVAKGYLLLRSPGALSSNGAKSPPGKSRLESQLVELELISTQEVAAPEFLETGYQLPIGFTNLQENRTALELSQQTDLKSELPAVTQTTAIDVKHSEIALIGELPLSDSNELIISLNLPANIGALTKSELILMAQEQHQLICVIERKEFELAIEKLHRVRLTGVYLQEFKKKCNYGEFENQLEQAGIGVRSAQNYMVIAKNWEIVEAKTHLVALLTEDNQPSIGLNWALEAVKNEKKSLKSAAPPKDPDSWRTPNTREQPIVDLVKQALGGNIWLDPCSDSSAKVPASVRYFKDDDGLAESNAWTRTVFVNPPFSDPSPWVEKCCLSIARGNVSAAIMLLKAGTVSNIGTGELISKYASAVCHWRGRIDFLNDEGNAVKGSDFDCVLIYFGDRLDLFRQAFSGRGTISTIENHYSSVNKKHLQQPATVAAEERQMAGAVGLSNGNGRSVLPDMRDRDRDLMERCDPNTVFDAMPQVSDNLFKPIEQPEIFDETPLVNQFQQAKTNCLNDYITAISSNLSEFSNEQILFLAKIINEESAKRIEF